MKKIWGVEVEKFDKNSIPKDKFLITSPNYKYDIASTLIENGVQYSDILFALPDNLVKKDT